MSEPLRIEDQQFLALAGLRTWAAAVVRQAERMQAAMDEQQGLIARAPLSGSLEEVGDRFRSERHLFLIAAWKLVEHMDWTAKLNCLDTSIFAEIYQMRRDIKDMRDMNEHAIKYFIGKGREQENWVHEDDSSVGDASATVGSLIGGRLDWLALSNAAKALLTKLW